MTDTVRAEEFGGTCAPSARASVCSVELDGETVIYDAESGVSHLLNQTGTLVWGCLDGDTTLDELVADLAAAYGVADSVVRDDVIALVRQLGRQRLLVGVA
jgi:PqqD family protein of HPr-rel-A system